MRSLSYISLLLLFLVGLGHAQTYVTQSLNDGWGFYGEGNTTKYPATVPGTVHTDLIKNKLIEDPYYRLNAESVQWVENVTWIYTSTFDADSVVFQNDRIELVFEGLDTHATVVLNNNTVLEAHNMWRKWTIDVKNILKQTGNTMTVTFYPAPLYDQQQIDKRKDLKIPCDVDSGRIYSRKAAYHFGWDWGVRLVTAGIWKNVYLQGWSGAIFHSVNLPIITLDSNTAFLNIQANMNVAKAANYTIKVSNADTGEIYRSAYHTFNVSNDTTLVAGFTINNPKFWWVRNLGEPYLYPIKVELIYQNQTIHQKAVNLGLRTIELVQERDSIGESFYFKINNVSVFAKGGNYIPPDVFMPRVTNATYDQIIQDAVDANYNFMRVWGGGNYESDYFYDLCDKYGLLIWQDFMFANAMYPADDADYLANLSDEIIENIIRLRNHPSIALWCGNNEIKNGWEDWDYQQNLTDAQKQEIYGWYQDIFNNIIPNYLKVTDPYRPYWPSSPLHGFGHPESNTEGDSHYYGVWAATAPIENYTLNVGRFMSEYGMQGWPSLNTVNKYTLPEDRWINSSVIQFHEKGAFAYYHVEYYILNYFRNATNFEKYLYLTQIMQSYAIQTAVEAHRYNKPRNMGTLMWQLNDDWPSFSWSSRDYYGAWKAVHYMVKRKYQDVIVSVVPSKDSQSKTQYDVYVVSEKLSDFKATLSVAIMDFNGTVFFSDVAPITCAAGSSKIYVTLSNDTFRNLDLTRSFIYANVTYDFQEGVSETTAYMVRHKDLQLANANVTVKVDVLKNTVTVQSDSLAIGVCVYTPGYDTFYNDNYFDLLPNTPKTLKFLRYDLLERSNALFNVLHLYKSYSDDAFEPKITIEDPRKNSMMMKKRSVGVSIVEK